jgi:hypothetical protein
MAKLTPFSRLLITVAILVGLFFLARNYVPALQNLGKGSVLPSTSSEVTDNDASASDDNTEMPAESVKTSSSSAFKYSSPAPVGGSMKGVVELGATGFNSFIVTIDAQKNWKLEKADYGSSLLYENMTSDAEISSGLKNYIADLLAYGVNGKDIHFVISSGAQKVEITKKIIAVLKGMKYFVNTVTAEQEGIYALKCVLPRAFQDKAFVVDIGSGNTKISWMQGGNIKSVDSFGSKYFQNKTPDNVVYQEIKTKSSAIPNNLRKTCFIIGGIPFELAKQVRTNKTERYTVLKAPGDYEVSGEKQKAGINIYKAVADATDCEEFVFDWDSNFTIGFLLDLK